MPIAGTVPDVVYVQDSLVICRHLWNREYGDNQVRPVPIKIVLELELENP